MSAVRSDERNGQIVPGSGRRVLFLGAGTASRNARPVPLSPPIAPGDGALA